MKKFQILGLGLAALLTAIVTTDAMAHGSRHGGTSISVAIGVPVYGQGYVYDSAPYGYAPYGYVSAPSNYYYQPYVYYPTVGYYSAYPYYGRDNHHWRRDWDRDRDRDRGHNRSHHRHR